MIFENAQVPVADLPEAETVVWMPLSPSYRQVEIIATCIFFGFFLAGWLVFYFVKAL